MQVFKIREKGEEKYQVRFAPRNVVADLVADEAYDVIPQSKTAAKRYFKQANKVKSTKSNKPNIAKRYDKQLQNMFRVKNNRKLKKHEVKGAYMIYHFEGTIKAFKVWTDAMVESLKLKFGNNYAFQQGVIINPKAVNAPIVFNLN